MRPRLGSFFSGYTGLDMAVEQALGVPVETMWHSDIKPAAAALLAHRYPEVPNLGDITAIDFGALPTVDILVGSWPCQPESSAGKRLGEADPRALWPYLRDAIAATRPTVFFGENVARIRTNGSLRRAVQDLAALGYVGSYRTHRASDVDACHRRDRCFVVAIDAASDAARDGWAQGWAGRTGEQAGRLDAAGGRGSAGLTLLPTPTRRDGKGPGLRDGERPDGFARSFRQLDLPGAVTLLPTPRAGDGVRGATDSLRDERAARQGRAKPTGLSLPVVAALLPTPTVGDARNSRNATAGRTPENDHHNSGWTLSDVAYAERWGAYAAAIARHEIAFGRPAPNPTQLSTRTGKPQLSARFVEWMMGLPAGWVTDVPGLAARPAGERNAMLSMLGDGVVPLQGATAFTELLGRVSGRAAA